MRLLAFLFLLIPTYAGAQGAATLVADNVSLEDGERLIATGNIEVLYDGTRLTATQIIYDGANDRLIITGPIIIQSDDGSIFTADSATLDPKLQNGMLRGARLVLDQQLQLAANQIDQVAGRYSQLYKASVTSCQICGDRPPLWDIRAERVIHDKEERQLYFDNAVFRVRGVPIFWIPRARLPDPTLKRATGFLIPQLRATNQLGSGIKIPYFIRIGDHRDLTLTPFFSNRTTTLEGRYRQAFLHGDLEINTAFSNDSLVRDQTRAYLFVEGAFDLGRDFQLNFDIEAVSDPAYLLDYGYSSKDRLDSAFEITRVRENDLFVGKLAYYRTLRDGESNSTLPPLVADIAYERRLRPAVGGTLTYGAHADTLARFGESAGEIGRDVSRIGASALWQNQWVHQSGLVMMAETGGRIDHYQINDDPLTESQISRFIPHGALTLRYPLHKVSKNAHHVLEPIVSVAWSDQYGGTPPNEDSTRPALDHGNLFSTSRFSGDDAAETGFRGAVGLNWARTGHSGAQSNLTFGRVFRDQADAQFNASSGLDGFRSDWMLAGQMEFNEGIRLEAQTLVSDELLPTLTAAKLDWQNERVDLAVRYLWQASDTALATAETSEWTFDAGYQFNDVWRVDLDTRYDTIINRAAYAGLEIEWRNECVTANLSVSRRFTSSTNVEPSTDFGFSVELNGFSTGRSTVGPAARCTN